MIEVIARGIFQVGGEGLSSGGDAAIYLVDGGNECALIDAGTGEGGEYVIRNVERAGVDPSRIKYLVITHCHIDHAGGAPGLKERLGLTTICHEKCAEILAIGNDPRTAAGWYGMKIPPMRIDVTFSGDEYILQVADAKLVLIFTPGHSPGSICAYLDRDNERVLFGQDVHGPIHPVLASDPDLYRASLKKLLALKADVLCEGHFGVYRRAEDVEAYIKSYL